MSNSKTRAELLGEKLKSARQEANLTQAQLAKQAELSTNYYAAVERGEENISARRLEKLEKVLGIKLLNI